jgi:ABC-type branched-subunit amino acid transport system substrate-binding protein
LAQSLHNNDFDSIFGKVSFDAKGDRVSPPLSWYQWKNNKMIEIQPITTTKN